jgi:hypothetical protein
MNAVPDYATGILTHAPLWVWTLLALPVWLGGLGLKRRRVVELPASWWPLARNLIIFFAHYALIAAAILTTQRAMLLQADIAVSGASAGYFIGWAVLLLRRYRAIPVSV